MKKEGNRVTRSSRVSESNVLDDLWFSPEERAALKLKIDLHSEIMKIVEKRGLIRENWKSSLINRNQESASYCVGRFQMSVRKS